MAKKQKRQFYIYLGIASLLLLCLFKMPYGFYTLVRFLAMAAFAYLAYLAYLEYKSKNMDRMVIFIVLAVLFQPFAKIALGRLVWNIVDVAVAIYLLYLSFKIHKK